MFKVTSVQEFETAGECFEALTPATTEIREIHGEQEIVRTAEDIKNIVAEQKPAEEEKVEEEQNAGEESKPEESGAETTGEVSAEEVQESEAPGEGDSEGTSEGFGFAGNAVEGPAAGTMSTGPVQEA